MTMRSAIDKLELAPEIELLIVPQGKPQTKPRALNYALIFARGKYVTIYDAEDIPEPNQLKLAAAKFSRTPQNIACLQAELAFYNSNENWLTRQFTIEYATLFKLILPALAKRQLPLPLGGTSNHFRTSILEKVGGWDPYNVTEDADLGFRLARLGFQTATLDSITYEEANTEVKNWLHQRSRWLKGFLQTWLVHMRNPFKVIKQIGFRGFATLQVTILGVFLSATLLPIFTGITIYSIIKMQTTDINSNLLGLILSSLYLTYFTLGGIIMMSGGKLALTHKGIKGWWFPIATMPVYWALASLAGWIALWQFTTAPFTWNKTKHGLSKFQTENLSHLHNSKN